MCVKCDGGWSTRKDPTKPPRWIVGDGYHQRHTVRPPSPGDPRYPAFQARKEARRNRRSTPVPPPPVSPDEHPSVRGIRSHLRKQEDLCDECAEYHYTPAYWTELRSSSLARVNRKLTDMAKDEARGYSVDRELQAYYLRKKTRLERQLYGLEEKPKRRAPDEPLARPMPIRFTVAQDKMLRERAEDEDTTVTELVRRAVDAWMVL